jgi:uncharacterized protein (TIGR00251 family)
MLKAKETPEGLQVAVLVEPGASRNRVYGEHDGRLKVSVTAPPEKGKANKALCRFLAAELGLSKSQVHVLSGHGSRLKEVLFERVSRDALDAIIA